MSEHPPLPPKNRELIWRGLFSENPVFRLALSLCPAVAVTSSMKNGFLMGVAVLAVQVLSSMTVAIARNFIHDKVRIPVYTIVIAVWVSVIDMVCAAVAPEIYAQIGLYIKLIVAFAIIISRLEVFASKFAFLPSTIDGFGMGLGFCFAMVLIGAFREVIGNGSIWGIELIPIKPLLLFILPAGGFFTIGLLMAAMNWIDVKRGGKLPTLGGGHG
ncbi:MAG: electron transport complex subunit RsxE [Deltaproteobacteria bacterium]|nr:electron transport complex subunit RsxE [Deltaproteobacteria bacterium]